MNRIYAPALLALISIFSSGVASATAPYNPTPAQKAADAALIAAARHAYLSGVPTAAYKASIHGIANRLAERRHVDAGGMKRWETAVSYDRDLHGVHGPWTPKSGQNYK